MKYYVGQRTQRNYYPVFKRRRFPLPPKNLGSFRDRTEAENWVAPKNKIIELYEKLP